MLFQRVISGPAAVIGDVHGHVSKLLKIIRQLQSLPDYQQRWIIFIGDLVDRGPDPKGVLDIFSKLVREHQRTTIVCGNHELAMAGFLELFGQAQDYEWGDRWIDHYGSESTFASYGAKFGDLQALQSKVPETHRKILQTAPWSVEHPDYFFVHAGLNPKTPFEEQQQILFKRDFDNRRPEWLCSKSLPFHSPPADCERVVVSGHVLVPQVTFAKRRILIDTTGGKTGSLSCVLLPEHTVLHSDELLAKPARFSPESDIADAIF